MYPTINLSSSPKEWDDLKISVYGKDHGNCINIELYSAEGNACVHIHSVDPEHLAQLVRMLKQAAATLVVPDPKEEGNDDRQAGELQDDERGIPQGLLRRTVPVEVNDQGFSL